MIDQNRPVERKLFQEADDLGLLDHPDTKDLVVCHEKMI
jgi:hypothetical protein